MLLNCDLGIKCYTYYIRVIDSFSTVLPIVNGGDWGCIVRDLETIIVFVLHAFNFIPKCSHYSLALTGHGLTGQGLCNANAWKWYSRYQSGVIGIIDKLKYMKKLQGVQEEQ